MKKLYENTFLRWLALIMLCISTICGVISLAGYAVVRFGPYNDADTYFDSYYAQSSVRGLAMDLGYALKNETSTKRAVPYENVGWVISRYDQKKKQFTVAETNQLEGYISSDSEILAFYEDGGMDIIQVTDESLDTQELDRLLDNNAANTGCKIDMYFTNPAKEADFGYTGFRAWSLVTAYQYMYLPALCISGVLSVILLIWCLCASGRQAGSEQYRLYAVDRIPLEAAAVAAVAGAYSAVRYGLLQFSDYYPRLEVGIAIIAVSVLGALIFILTLLFSIARRAKTGTLLRYTLVYGLYSLVKKLIRFIPEMPFTALGCVFLWLLNWFTAYNLKPGFFMFMVIMVDLFAAVYVMYKTWCSNEAAKATALVVDGRLQYRMDPKQIERLTPAERTIMNNLGRISEGMKKAVEEQMKSERLKTELITNVSHDIKTPLTSIVSYTDLLQKEEDEEKKQEYLEVISRNAARLKKLSEDLVEASKASTGNVHTEIVPVSLSEMTEQALAEYEEKLEKAELKPVVSIHDPAAAVKADGRLLWRVLSNLLSNCVKYAQPGTRVYIDSSEADENHIFLSVKNISRDILNISADELMERFVRGDQSRSSEGSGLGLNIARSLTELMGGKFDIRIDGDLFRADILLEKASDSLIPEETGN